jgi:ketosteroid isomerase-like protein
MTNAKSKGSDEAQILALIEARVKAVHAKDVNRAMEGITPDILLFDVVNPLHHHGSDAERKRMQEWFSSF